MHWCVSYKGSKWGVQTAPPGKHLRRRYLNTPVLTVYVIMKKFGPLFGIIQVLII